MRIFTNPSEQTKKSGRRKCSECRKPLGSTIDKCHECGGETYRGGRRETDNVWKVWMGLQPTQNPTTDPGDAIDAIGGAEVLRERREAAEAAKKGAGK